MNKVYNEVISNSCITFIISGNNSFLKSGLSSYGGLIGVLIASIVFEKIHPTNSKIIKYTALSLPLVYSGTKVACFLAGCCYGIPYNGIFSVTYVDGLNISLFPIQIAETISFLVIFIVCNSLKKNKWITYITLIVTILTKLFFFKNEDTISLSTSIGLVEYFFKYLNISEFIRWHANIFCNCYRLM